MHCVILTSVQWSQPVCVRVCLCLQRWNSSFTNSTLWWSSRFHLEYPWSSWLCCWWSGIRSTVSSSLSCTEWQTKCWWMSDSYTHTQTTCLSSYLKFTWYINSVPSFKCETGQSQPEDIAVPNVSTSSEVKYENRVQERRSERSVWVVVVMLLFFFWNVTAKHPP